MWRRKTEEKKEPEEVVPDTIDFNGNDTTAGKRWPYLERGPYVRHMLWGLFDFLDWSHRDCSSGFSLQNEDLMDVVSWRCLVLCLGFQG